MRGRYESFCVNAVAALCLCWFVEDYPVAEYIAASLSSQPLSASFLLRANELLLLLNTPVFQHVRLHWMDVRNPTFLAMLRSIYGFLMLLPQSDAYNGIQNRLSSLTSLYYVLRGEEEYCVCCETPCEIGEQERER